MEDILASWNSLFLQMRCKSKSALLCNPYVLEEVSAVLWHWWKPFHTILKQWANGWSVLLLVHVAGVRMHWRPLNEATKYYRAGGIIPETLLALFMSHNLRRREITASLLIDHWVQLCRIWVNTGSCKAALHEAEIKGTHCVGYICFLICRILWKTQFNHAWGMCLWMLH